MTKKIIGALREERALCEDCFVAEDVVETGWVADDDAGRKTGDGDVKCFIAVEGLAAGEPCEEFLAGL